MVKFNVAVESHPAAFVVLKVYVPLWVYVLPFQLYESHDVMSVEDVVGCLMVKCSVAVESHPPAFVVLKVYVPLWVYVLPFQL